MNTSIKDLIDNNIELCIQKTRRNVNALEPHFPAFPFAANERSWLTSGEDDWKDPIGGYWTAGYWIGILWICYKITGDRYFHDNARRWLAKLTSRCGARLIHDVGFIFYPACTLGYELTHDEEDIKITAKRAAYTLARLFNRKHGCIPIGDHEPVRDLLSIETMLCLPLLFWADNSAELPDAGRVAESHFITTVKHLVRDDGSTCNSAHLSTAGIAPRFENLKGFSESSCWARGHACAVSAAAHGLFHKGHSFYSDTLHKLLNYYETNTPPDGVPYWDYSAPDIPDAPRDTTAAAIMVQSLALFANNNSGDEFFGKALPIIKTLSESYFADVENPGFLKRARVDSQNIDFAPVSNVCADYYYLFALFLTTRQGADFASALLR